MTAALKGSRARKTFANEYLRSLVQTDRVHSSTYTDPDIFELEMDRIFGRVWVYVGHESQIPKPGGFFCTRIARQPVVMSRHVDGKVYVLFNRCGHRGAKVLNEECGHARVFTCMYHGWCRAQNLDHQRFPLDHARQSSPASGRRTGEGSMLGWLGWGIVACFRSRTSLAMENICLRQQLVALRRRQPRPRIHDTDRRFWVLACRWFTAWRGSLLIVRPETVLRWHRRGWRAYWRWQSRRRGKPGRRPIAPELQTLIRRLAAENCLWGQQRIQAELTRLGFQVSARSVAKYMRRPWDGEPSPGWRRFLKQHASAIWACDFLCVQTIFFRTLHVFFVIDHASREVLHVQPTRHPTAEWVAQQIVECCGWERAAPRFLIHDRDSRYGAAFDRRLANLGITQIRTPFRSPRANAIAERWVRSLRTECLDHLFILNERHLRAVLEEYGRYFNRWRPHRSIGQRAPCAVESPSREAQNGMIVGEPVLGGLHHVYHLAA